MSNEKHTQGRLKLDTCPRCDVHDLTLNGKSILQSHYVGDSSDGDHEGAVSDLEIARRLVACWNALLPFTTEQVEAGVDLAELANQRDVLLAALEADANEMEVAAGVMWSRADGVENLHKLAAQALRNSAEKMRYRAEQTRAAIAKVKGGAA